MGVIVEHVRLETLTSLLLLGAAVGIGAVGVWLLELRINVPDWMVRVAMLTLAVAGVTSHHL